VTRHLTLPNQLTILRLLLVPVIGYTLSASWAYHDQVSVAVYGAAAATDTLDGRIARSRNMVSELGKFLDPLADKLLLVTVFVECAWLGLAPWWLTSAVVARDVLIALGALAYRLLIGPLRGRPTLSSKINTAMQLLFPVAMLAKAALNFPPHEVLDALAILVFITTVFSGLNYMAIFTRRAWATPVSRS